MQIDYCYTNDELIENVLSCIFAYIKQCRKEKINIALGTGETLIGLTSALTKCMDFPFSRVNLYIVDEYVGLDPYDPASCTYDLIMLLKEKLEQFNSVHFFSPQKYQSEIIFYNHELKAFGLDICILGMGHDGHIAFCTPPIESIGSSFYVMRKLSLAEKQTHVHKGWFSTVNAVPPNVITLTLWGIKQSELVIVCAKYSKTKEAIKKLESNKIFPFKLFPIGYFAQSEKDRLYVEMDN